jgi:hypothetical protein
MLPFRKRTIPPPALKITIKNLHLSYRSDVTYGKIRFYFPVVVVNIEAVLPIKLNWSKENPPVLNPISFPEWPS